MKKILCLFLSIIFVCFNSYSSETIGIDSAYPPYMHGSKHVAKGLYVQLLKNIFQKMNVGVVLEAKPWKRIMKKAKIGKWGVGGIYKNSERVKIFDYSEPIYHEKLVLFINKSSNLKFNSLEDLRGKKLGVMRGWSYGESFDKARKSKVFSVMETNKGKQSFALLLKNKVDGVVMDGISAKIILEKNNWAGKVKEETTPVARNAAYIVFLKSMKKSGVINKFNNALAKMRKDGSYDKIISSFVKE